MKLPKKVAEELKKRGDKLGKSPGGKARQRVIQAKSARADVSDQESITNEQDGVGEDGDVEDGVGEDGDRQQKATGPQKKKRRKKK